MSTIVWPSGITPPQVTLGLKANTQVFTSDLDGSVQTLELPGARWVMSFSTQGFKRSNAALLESMIAQLRGQANRLRVPVFGRRAPQGTWAGAPKVNNEVGSPTLSQTGTSMYINGLTTGATGKAGDFFNIGSNGELKMLTADFSESGGAALISFYPEIRTAPAHSTSIVTANCVVPQMILKDPQQTWRIAPNGLPNDGFADFSFDLVEVFG